MEKRSLGQSGIAIAPIVFGGNVFGWTADEARSFELLDRFAERGFNAVDTADVYSVWVPGHKGGESETLLGQWLKQRGRRDDVLIHALPIFHVHGLFVAAHGVQGMPGAQRLRQRT